SVVYGGRVGSYSVGSTASLAPAVGPTVGAASAAPEHPDSTSSDSAATAAPATPTARPPLPTRLPRLRRPTLPFRPILPSRRQSSWHDRSPRRKPSTHNHLISIDASGVNLYAVLEFRKRQVEACGELPSRQGSSLARSSTTSAAGRSASAAPGSMILEPRMPEPMITDSCPTTRESISSRQPSGRPIGPMPP